MSVGHGGQILRRRRAVGDLLDLFQVVGPGLPSEFPPPRRTRRPHFLAFDRPWGG
jgi:hypothetical protein